MFKDLKDYKEYLVKHPFYKKIGICSIDDIVSPESKMIQSLYFNVTPDLEEAFPAELDDLIRLHYLVVTRKVTTILELGVGKSTFVFDDALEYNKTKYGQYISSNLRRSNLFECHSIDNNAKWLDEVTKSNITNTVKYYFSEVNMSTFNGKICTFYDELPNVCPDLIYIDGPDQFSVKNDIRGISTRHPDRLPMSGDILAIEHFLLPGTLIVIDGRTANARFLKANLQRDWNYVYYEEYDQHIFELLEQPLGVYNKKQIDFCLGEEYYERLCKNHNKLY
jgi:hypothetical protein